MLATQTLLIHPTAVVHETARIHPTAQIGAYCFVGPFCEIGEGCVLHHHVSLVTHTILGEFNTLHSQVVLGGDPQDFKYKGETSWLKVGNHNVFREFSTVHRATGEAQSTTVGDYNYIMAYVHIGHNSRMGDHNTIANGTQIAGHIIIEDYIVMGGLVACHQGIHIGSYSMIGGCSGVRRNVPPYALIVGADEAKIAGLNTVGLRRNGFNAQTRVQIKQAYRQLFYSTDLFRDRLNTAKAHCKEDNPALKRLIDFVEEGGGSRGLCGVTRRAHNTSISLEHEEGAE